MEMMVTLIENFNGVGERISKKLDEMGLKQVDVCSSIRISKNAMSNYVSGKRIPETMVIYKLSKFFSVSIEWLLTGKENELNNYHSSENSSIIRDFNSNFELLSIYHQLTEKEQGKVIGYIEAMIDINRNINEATSLELTYGEEDAEG